jgi:hypothetical protein
MPPARTVAWHCSEQVCAQQRPDVLLRTASNSKLRGEDVRFDAPYNTWNSSIGLTR